MIKLFNIELSFLPHPCLHVTSCYSLSFLRGFIYCIYFIYFISQSILKANSLPGSELIGKRIITLLIEVWNWEGQVLKSHLHIFVSIKSIVLLKTNLKLHVHTRIQNHFPALGFHGDSWKYRLFTDIE